MTRPNLIVGFLFIILCLGCGRHPFTEAVGHLRIVTTGEGRVFSTAGINCLGTCDYQFPAGTQIQLRVSPETGTEFGEWDGDGSCSGTLEACDLEVRGGHNHVAAKFGFRLAVDLPGSGQGNIVSDPPGIDCPGDCSDVYQDGDVVNLTATVGTDSTFKGYKGEPCGTATGCTIVMGSKLDIDGVFYGGAPRWGASFGGSDGTETEASDDYGNAVGVASSGAIYVAGLFRNSVNFGTGLQQSAGGSDQYIAVLDGNGTTQDVLVSGTTGNDGLLGMSIDGNNVFVSGYRTDPALGDLDAVVQRLEPDTMQWTQTLASGGNDFAIGVAALGNGRVATAGQAAGTVDVLLAELAGADGAQASANTYGNGGQEVGWGVADDAVNNLYVVGDYNGTLAMGGDPLPLRGDLDGFITKYDANRNFRWSMAIAGPGPDSVYSVTTWGTDVIVGGSFSDTVDLGGGNTLESSGGKDAYVARFDDAGALKWAFVIGGAGHDEAFSVSTDTDGNILATGYFSSNDVDLGDGPLSHHGGADILAVKLDRDGKHLWSYGYGGPADDVGYSIASGPDNEPVVAAGFHASMLIDGKMLQSAGGFDAAVLKLAR